MMRPVNCAGIAYFEVFAGGIVRYNAEAQNWDFVQLLDYPLFKQYSNFAKVAELVDALDLGSSAARRESSSLSFRTNMK